MLSVWATEMPVGSSPPAPPWVWLKEHSARLDCEELIAGAGAGIRWFDSTLIHTRQESRGPLPQGTGA